MALVAVLSLSAARGARAVSGAVLRLTPDHVTHWEWSFDVSLQRLVVAKNVGDAPGVWSLNTQLPASGGSPTCMPQGGEGAYLYLAPGESERIICQVGEADLPQLTSWAMGSKHSVPILLEFDEKGQPPQKLTLDNTVTVIWPCGPIMRPTPPGTPADCKRLKHPNATIKGRVIDATTRRPLRSALFMVITEGTFGYNEGVNSSAAFSVPILAHKRPFSRTWLPYAIVVNAQGYATANVIVTPRPGHTSRVTIALHKPTARGSYRLVNKVDTHSPVARMAVSADGRYAAIAPYSDSPIAPSHAYLSFFDIRRAKLLWRYPLQGKVLGVDLSDNGRWIASPYPGRHASQDPTGAPNLVLLNHAGHVVWIRHVFGEAPKATVNGQQVQVPSYGPRAVKFSHDAHWLAYGAASGQLTVIDRATQALRWRVFLGGQVRDIAWSPDDSQIYASSGDNHIYALDAATGKVLWKTDIGGWSNPWAVSKNYILASPKQGYSFVAVHTGNGSIAWQKAVVGSSWAMAISPSQSLFASVNNTGVAPGTGVFNTSGKLRWAVPERATAVTFSGNGRYLVVDASTSARRGNPPPQQDELQLFNVQTGELLFSRGLTQPPGKWTYEAGVLYVSNDASTILIGSQKNGYVYFFKGEVSQIKHR